MIAPRFNIAPSQAIAVVREDEAQRRTLALLKWGLVPHWAKDPAHVGTSVPPINARSEGVESKPTFRDAMKRRRCLVPADGFYEWKKLTTDGKVKQPYYITMADHEHFAMAGLWERWGSNEGPDGVLESCAVLTCAANEMMRDLHDRMPVILPRSEWEAWLGADTPVENALAMLRPLAGERIRAVPVSARVNSPKNTDASLIAPLNAEELVAKGRTPDRASGRPRKQAGEEGESLWD